ncbi:MAG: hypothetical protein IPJ24_04955 [bacterium]|nr:hypothetical protein [bacterium]
MELSSLTIRIAVLLLPGLIAAVLVERLTVHPKWEQFRFGTYALILGCASYVSLDAVMQVVAFLGRHVFHCQCPVNSSDFLNAMFDSTASPKASAVLGASVVAVLLGLALAKVVQGKWMFRFASRLGVSDKYGDENLFTFFINSPDTSWLWVRDRERSVIYEGLKDSMSETDSICELVLTDVKVYHAETAELLYEVPAVYLSYKPGQFTIEMATKATGG